MIKKIRDWLRRKLPFVIVITLIILLVAVYFWRLIFITIHTGEAGVKYLRFFGGTITDYVYKEGFHIIFPWDILTIYNVRIQTVLHDFKVLTNRGLPIQLRLAIRFRPEYDLLGMLHKEVGPDYINTIIIPQVESVLRKKIGHYQPEEIYINREGFFSKIILSALEEAGQKYVIIDDVIIRTVTLPPTIKEAIEEKLIQEQLYLAYQFKIEREKQEAERKRIEATGIQSYQHIIRKTLDDQIIRWQGVQATKELAESENAKVVVIGAGKEGLPLILGTDR